ncbi:MAG: SseB family protein [Pseudomonadota bacterium]
MTKTTTPLDHALQAMQAATDDTPRRLQYFERVMDAELFLPLADGDDDVVTPGSQLIQDVEYVLAFDLEARLSDHAGGLVEHLTVSGRGLVEMLVGQQAGILLNAGQDSENTIPPDTITWLAQMSGVTPDEVDESPVALHPPKGVDEGLILALDTKFSTMRGMADYAVLVLAEYADDRRQPLVGVIGAIDGSEPDIARALSEAAQFSGANIAAVDVVFLPIDHSAVARMNQVGLKFQIPRAAGEALSAAPGSNPDKPPLFH